MRKLLTVALALLLSPPGPGLAADKAEPADKWELPSHVQLSPITVPVAEDKYRAVPLTFYLEVHDKEKLGQICRMSPKIRDVILDVTFRSPVEREGKYAFDLAKVRAQVLGPINRALGRTPMVKKVFVQLGARRFGKGAVMKLPFGAASGCRSIKELEAKRIKAQQQK